MGKHNFPKANIYNEHEMGISTIQKPERILSPKDKQVGAETSWEREGTSLLCVQLVPLEVISLQWSIPVSECSHSCKE
jgi:hypothetical protein